LERGLRAWTCLHGRSSSSLEVKRPAADTGDMTGELTIGELARRSGVATSALRFYEDKGLIHADRATSGHRRYLRSVLRRIAFIVFAQRVGLSLDEVAVELAKLPRNRVPDAVDRFDFVVDPVGKIRAVTAVCRGGANGGFSGCDWHVSGWPCNTKSRAQVRIDSDGLPKR